MKNDMMNLEPKAIWKHFHSLTQIPRPSKKEERIIQFMKEFGESLGLETIVDKVGNVIIRKPATPGMENRVGIVLQGHLDMVPQKNSDKQHDFEKDPIETIIDGDWLKANGTTLGSDNGMGVAAAMAVLEDKNLVHGPIETLFTVDEESGMTGAFNLQPDFLKGDILLNMDSEDEGELYIGCAGGINGNFKFAYVEEKVPAGMKSYKISISGLKGGHSGLDIPLGRGNSCKITTRIIHHGILDHGMCLSSIDAGNMRNAIPREATAVVVLPEAETDKFNKCFTGLVEKITAELAVTEPDLAISFEPVAMPDHIMDIDAQNRMIKAVYGCPNGVMRMSDAMAGLVETSTNLSIVKSGKGEVKVICLLRSSVDSAKADLVAMMGSIFELAGAQVEFNGEYPGWKPNPDSAILKLMQEVYLQHYSKIPEIKAIHAGLECGILGAAYPNWDMISFGPTIRFPHSPDEKVNIPSVVKFYDYLLHTLKNVPVKK
ncbi:MAG: aminoacyl-histidine dipeptidase [Bacteroidales bacterium]|nr:aminoacyl-histidine dipeptidase [Bacteroidales bacterium]MDZ4203370.1 aminoacyl-histidine dipeptidase [Bacteroidales bacterium]